MITIKNRICGRVCDNKQLHGKICDDKKIRSNLPNNLLKGLSAYEIAVRNGFVGTEAEWLVSLIGETGNGIESTTLNDDYTLTIVFTDGTTYTTSSIRGAEGHSPIITATKNNGTTTVYIDGVAVASINDGIDGVDGDDGFSPSVGITQITGGHRISITDAQDTEVFDVFDGIDGDSGVYIGTTEPTNNANVWIDPSGEADSHVSSVNGKTGAVVLSASDVGALQSAPVTDVQVNGVSILSNGVANIPMAGNGTLGAVKVNSTYGNMVLSNGDLVINSAGSTFIKGGANSYYPLVPHRQHEAVFYGLAKAAGEDMASSNNAVGTYTTAAKTAICTMIGSEESSNKVTSISASSTDTQYPSAKCVYDMVGSVESLLAAI